MYIVQLYIKKAIYVKTSMAGTDFIVTKAVNETFGAMNI